MFYVSVFLLSDLSFLFLALRNVIMYLDINLIKDTEYLTHFK